MESLLLPADPSNFAQTLDAAATFSEHEALKEILGGGSRAFSYSNRMRRAVWRCIRQDASVSTASAVRQL